MFVIGRTPCCFFQKASSSDVLKDAWESSDRPEDALHVDERAVKNTAAKILVRLRKRGARIAGHDRIIAENVWDMISKGQRRAASVEDELLLEEKSVKLLTLKLLRKMRKDGKAKPPANPLSANRRA